MVHFWYTATYFILGRTTNLTGSEYASIHLAIFSFIFHKIRVLPSPSASYSLFTKSRDKYLSPLFNANTTMILPTIKLTLSVYLIHFTFSFIFWETIHWHFARRIESFTCKNLVSSFESFNENLNIKSVYSFLSMPCFWKLFFFMWYVCICVYVCMYVCR